MPTIIDLRQTPTASANSIQPEVARSRFAEQDRRPTMGNGVSSDQGNLPSYGKREVRRAVDRKQHDWSELAGMSETDLLLAAANPYNMSNTQTDIGTVPCRLLTVAMEICRTALRHTA